MTLRQRREAAGLTRIELAERAHVSLTFLSNCEHGHIPRKSQALERIEKALKATEEAA